MNKTVVRVVWMKALLAALKRKIEAQPELMKTMELIPGVPIRYSVGELFVPDYLLPMMGSSCGHEVRTVLQEARRRDRQTMQELDPYPMFEAVGKVMLDGKFSIKDDELEREYIRGDSGLWKQDFAKIMRITWRNMDEAMRLRLRMEQIQKQGGFKVYYQYVPDETFYLMCGCCPRPLQGLVSIGDEEQPDWIGQLFLEDPDLDLLPGCQGG